ncbi:MAG TPA: hemolysin family protein [Candidatus Onthovivens sp.]|nr:hemolysin family protein [Candidatus Onthovivens sp.]
MYTLYFIVIAILLIFSMFFSSADMAFSSVSLARLEAHYALKPSKSCQIAIKLTKNYEKTIATLLFGNNLVNIGATSIVTVLAILIATNFQYDESLATTIGSFSLLGLLLIFGEIIPKSIVKVYSFRSSLIFAYPVYLFTIIFTPLTYIFSLIGRGLSYPFTHNVKDLVLTDKELQEMAKELEFEGLIDNDKKEIIKGTIIYANTEAYEIMTPRVDLYAIDIEDELEEILLDDETYIHSRIPVYEESIDNILGFIYVKDLVELKLLEKDIDLRSIIKTPLYFPRSTEINDILREFKAKKVSFAVILDEYGGVEGIVTLEDILEEIVGEIWDETDDKEQPFHRAKDGTYIIDGQMNLEDFFDLFDLDYEEIDTEYITIGGFIIELLDDKFAKVGQVINYKNLVIKVLAIDKRTVEKIKVRIKTIKKS